MSTISEPVRKDSGRIIASGAVRAWFSEYGSINDLERIGMESGQEKCFEKETNTLAASE